MKQRALRFRPPEPPFSPELRWCLLRAFGPEAAPWAGPLDPKGVFETAVVFDLASRIGARVAVEKLTSELGPPFAGFLALAQAATEKRERVLVGLLEEVAAVGATAGGPMAFLKFGALHLHGVLRPGSRPAGDIDVLVPEKDAEPLAVRFRERGFRISDLPEYPHQLPPLADAAGRVLELHRHVPGVRVGGARGFATYADLEAARLLEPVAALPGCSVPTRELLAAHLLVHAIAQHGFAPDSYSPFRVVGDLIDLGGSETGELLERAHPLIAAELTAAESRAAGLLCRRLAAGDASLFDASSSVEGEGVLLRHFVAGVLDPRYGRGLRLSSFFRGLAEGSRLAALLKGLRGALSLTDGQIVAIYGRPRSRVGYLVRRLARPFDLSLRLVRYALSAFPR